MTSMEIAALVEESEQARSHDEPPKAAKRSRRLLVVLVPGVLVVAGVAYHFLAGGTTPAKVSPSTVTRQPLAPTTASVGGSHAAGPSVAVKPVPVAQYFSVKNPFAPLISSGAVAGG